MKNAKALFCFFISFVIMVTAGCTTLTKNYGTMVPNKEAGQAFRSYQPDPNHTYYFCGSDVYPNAIFGLDKAYTLNNVLWQKIKTPDVFKKLVAAMQHKADDVSRFLFGFAILDNNGRQIGTWYSILNASTPVKMEDEHTVTVFTVRGNVYDTGDDPF